MTKRAGTSTALLRIGRPIFIETVGTALCSLLRTLPTAISYQRSTGPLGTLTRAVATVDSRSP